MFVLLAALWAGLFSPGGLGALEPPLEERVYYIRSVSFEVDGRTRPFALLEKGEFKEGERLAGDGALERYRAEKRRLLLNERVLESVQIDYALGAEEEREGELLVPVDLMVRVKDTWNIIALPYPKYDDNTGFELSIKARDYNFLGAMNPLRLDLGYELDETKVWDFSQGNVRLEIDSDTPFTAFGYTWTLNFDHLLVYSYGEPLFYKNTTGLSLDLPYKRTAVTLGFNEYLLINEENAEEDRARYGDRFGGAYMATELFASWKIPTGLRARGAGEISFTPKFSGRVNYRPGGVDDPRTGPALRLGGILGFGQVDWIGNYRQGIKAEAELAGGYTFYPPAYYRPPPVPPPPPEASPALPPRSRWNNTFSVDVLGYLALTPYFGISGRIRLRNWFNDPYREGGDDLRGLLNRHLQARAILSLNLDFPFRVLRVYPSEWFQNGKLRFFDFELHGSPFVDLALAAGETGNPRGSLRETSFSPGDLYWTGGLELILFPAFMRSIYLRVSLGYNFRELIRTGEVSPWDELFIGFGHQY